MQHIAGKLLLNYSGTQSYDVVNAATPLLWPPRYLRPFYSEQQ